MRVSLRARGRRAPESGRSEGRSLPASLAALVASLLFFAWEARAQPAPMPAKPPAPVIVPPKLLSDPSVAYPEGATGDATVILVVVVSAAGSVQSATAEQDNEPFSSRATVAALEWKFQPA